MKQEPKMFDLGDILSITTGYLVSPRHMDGVSDILSFMVRESLFTHVLPRASDACKPALLEQHPQLKNIVDPGGKPPEGWTAWVANLKSIYGEQFLVKPLEPGRWILKHPLVELREMVGPNKPIIVVGVG